MPPLVTLTTDFGAGSVYVAAMKGVFYSVCRKGVLVDLTHSIPPQNLAVTNFFLHATISYYPPNTLHIVVIDPGVGTQRAILYVEWCQQRLLVPDNGCWTLLAKQVPPQRVIKLSNPNYWRSQISTTFHGRDIFAPVAAHLSCGLDPLELGEIATQWNLFSLPIATLENNEISGEVVWIDDFGNILTNIPAEMFANWQASHLQVQFAKPTICRHVRTYGEAEIGEVVVLVSSMQTLEVAINQANAAQHLQVRPGTPVKVRTFDTN